MLCILKGFLLSLDIFRRHLVPNIAGYKIKFLKKMSLNFGPRNFQHLKNQQNQGQHSIYTVHTINFDRKFNRKNP